jgi:hypothetical protein
MPKFGISLLQTEAAEDLNAIMNVIAHLRLKH